MSDRFDCFVVFAEMRTGSNFLEANLNAFDGLTCHGEAFNPFSLVIPIPKTFWASLKPSVTKTLRAFWARFAKRRPMELEDFATSMTTTHAF